MHHRTQYTLLATSLAATLFAVTSAMADGEPSAAARSAPVAPAAPAEQVSWSGPWVGVGGGVGESAPEINSIASVDEFFSISEPKYIKMDLESTETESNSLEIFGSIFDRGSFDDGDWNGFGTVALGYDRQFGNIVVGLFTDFDFYPDARKRHSETLSGQGEIVECSECGGEPSLVECVECGPETFPLHAKLRSDVHIDEVWSLGGRIGYLVRPNTLLYFLGGYARANLDGETSLTYDQFFNRDGPKTVSVKAPDHLSGYFLGAGGEMFIRDNLSLKFEYRFTHFDGKRGSDSSEVFDRFCDWECIEHDTVIKLDTDIDADIHSVRGSLVFHLDDDRAATPLK